MMNNLTVIYGGGKEPTDAQRYLEDRLKEVKSGDIVGVVTICLYAHGGLGTGWSSECEKDVFTVLGGIHHIAVRFDKEAANKD